MKVFIAGASGALGMRLVPRLVASGHDVVGMTRSTAKAQALRKLGAEAAVADGLDQPAVIAAVLRAEPDVIVHQMTALTGLKSFRRFDRVFAQTNRLRTEGTDNLLEAARLAGARRFVAQSFGGWTYEPSGGPVKSEDDPFDPSPPAAMSQSLEAIKRLESAVLGADSVEGVVLRYGGFYGPGTNLTTEGDIPQLMRKRRLPVIGDGAGVWSFAHIDDAAAATELALDHGTPGVYNVADDEPAPASVWMPELAAALGAPRPRRVPVWVGRLAGGAATVSLMTQARGISNAKAKRAFGWQPRYASWRDGFRNGLDVPLPAAPARDAA